MESIAEGNVDVGIFQQRAASFYARQRNLDLIVHHEVQASIRLHKSKTQYLGAINAAITAMEKEGVFKDLSAKHATWIR